TIEYLDIKEIYLDHILFGPKDTTLTKLPSHIKKILNNNHNIIKPKNEEKWNLILNNQTINWKKIYKTTWTPPVFNKWNHTYWLILRYSLFLGEKAEKLNLDFIPYFCHTCPSQIESHPHLFFHCPNAKIIWNWCSQKWNQIN